LAENVNYPIVLPNGEKIYVYYEADGKGEGKVTVTFDNPKWLVTSFKRTKYEGLSITVSKAEPK
jgi:hypothetical protein